MLNDVSVFNIREYLSNQDDEVLGEEALKEILSEFYVKRIRMLKDFSKNNQLNLPKRISLRHT